MSTPRDLPPQLGASHTDQSEYASGTTNIDLIRRRQAHLGASILFYHDPVHIVRGRGVWLYDPAGRQYLDCYNNVASVGHCHPHVVEALCAQAHELNTHTRYLHETVVEYAEKLAGSLPPGLDICMFVCTGTEANELAMRLARAATGGNGAIVMEAAYHGNSTLVNELSTLAHPVERRPDHVVAVEPPNLYRGPYRAGEPNAGASYADLVDAAIGELEARGQGTAAFLCDTIFDTQGTLEAPADYFRRVYEKVRAAGGVCIADEVQAGLARTGRMWGFEHYDVVPDIVTLGKPMGDGHPVAAVVTTAEIAAAFARSNLYFNTFGGNPVSAAVGKAVLEVIEEEKLVQHVSEVGAYLRDGLGKLAERHPIIGDVRGKGLFQGIELVADREARKPASEVARKLPDRMRDEGILIGLSGRLGNVLKVRPPLVFSRENADQLVETLDRVLP
jgi:4-aminobutyrate aminotransferase-like enzyme